MAAITAAMVGDLRAKTDKFVADIDKMVTDKEKEVMTV